MKKIILVAMLLLVAFSLIACDEPSTTTPSTTTSAGPSTTTSATTTPGVTTPSTTTPTTTGTQTPAAEHETTEDYDAILNTEKWVGTDTIDYNQFTNFGSGSALVNEINVKYNGYKKSYTTTAEDGTTKTLTSMEVKKLDIMGAVVKADDAAKTVSIALTPVEVTVMPTWESVTAKAGSYLMFDFYTNCNIEFVMTVTATEGGSSQNAAYTQDGVTVTKTSNGKYTGVAKCTVPYRKGTTMYINICLDNTQKTVMASIPVTITEAKYDSAYALMFQGDWELIRDEEYLPNLIDLFYNVYPRLYARFAFGTEPKTITFMADKNYDGVAYCAGTTVCVSVNYANSNPSDLGFFSHEITHSVQQYNQLNYGDDGQTYNGKSFTAWWTENMANYGGFRYFHWGYSTKFVQIYNVQTNTGLQDWGYQAYGDGSKLFLSYLDWKFPTTDANKDGKITVDEYGVIDRINYTIKNATSKMYDTPNNPNTPFNQAVYAATKGEFDCIEAIRQYYAKECQEGTWVFTGFRDYVDNFLTEDLEGIPNPTYPMLEEVEKGNKTATMLTTPVTEGTNLALNVKVVAYSGDQTANPIANAFDGDLNTRWQSKKGSDGDKKYELGGYEHEVIIDLGEVKSFNTYTLVSAGYKNTDTFNTREWEIFVSSDGENWTSVDYQNEINQDIASFNIGEQSARYVKLRLFRSDRSNVGMARIQEFMLFDVK